MGRSNSKIIAIGVHGNPQIELGTNELSQLLELSANKNNVRSKLLLQAKDDITKKIIKELYREGATIGDGSTADAVRYEITTGKLIGGKSHIIKAKERINQIEKILKIKPNHPDKTLLLKLKADLELALKGDDKY